jgi:hypothetical protein
LNNANTNNNNNNLQLAIRNTINIINKNEITTFIIYYTHIHPTKYQNNMSKSTQNKSNIDNDSGHDYDDDIYNPEVSDKLRGDESEEELREKYAIRQEKTRLQEIEMDRHFALIKQEQEEENKKDNNIMQQKQKQKEEERQKQEEEEGPCEPLPPGTVDFCMQFISLITFNPDARVFTDNYYMECCSHTFCKLYQGGDPINSIHLDGTDRHLEHARENGRTYYADEYTDETGDRNQYFVSSSFDDDLVEIRVLGPNTLMLRNYIKALKIVLRDICTDVRITHELIHGENGETSPLFQEEKSKMD